MLPEKGLPGLLQPVTRSVAFFCGNRSLRKRGDSRGGLPQLSPFRFVTGFQQVCTGGGARYFEIASITRFMISSLRFFMPNQTTIAIEAPRPIPIPQKMGVMIV